MVCPQCNRNIPDDAKSCFCGWDLSMGKIKKVEEDVPAFEFVSPFFRLFHYIFDNIIIFVFYYFFLLFTKQDITPEVMLKNSNSLVYLAMFFLYYFILEYFFQASVAKLITGCVIINPDGTKPGLRSLVIRSFLRIFSIEPFIYILTGWMLHDVLSKTFVIRKKKFF